MRNFLVYFCVGIAASIFWSRPLLSCTPCLSTLGLQETIAQADLIFVGQKIRDVTEPGIPPETPPEIIVRIDRILKGFVKEKELRIHSFSGMCPYGIVVDDKPYLMFIKGPPYTAVNLGCAVKTLPASEGLAEVAKFGLTAPGKQKPDLLFLLDFSKRWDCLQEALQNAVSKFSPEQEVGLRVFGHRPPDIFDGGCRDTELLLPIGKEQKEKMMEAFRGLEMREKGDVPLAYSLLQTGSDFGPRKDRLHKLVIISHGEDTCDEDTLLAARNVANMGYALEVSVIGLRAEGAAQEQLQGIAKEFGGTFTNVTSCQEMEELLAEAAPGQGTEQKGSEGIEAGGESEAVFGCGKGGAQRSGGDSDAMEMSSRQKKGCGMGLPLLLILIILIAVWRYWRKRKQQSDPSKNKNEEYEP